MKRVRLAFLFLIAAALLMNRGGVAMAQSTIEVFPTGDSSVDTRAVQHAIDDRANPGDTILLRATNTRMASSPPSIWIVQCVPTGEQYL